MQVTIPKEFKTRFYLMFFSAALLLSGVLVTHFSPGSSDVGQVFALVGTLLIAAPILWDTMTAIKSSGFEATQFFMDQYVLLALAACIATERYLTGGTVALILVFGQMLEERTVIGVELALTKLVSLTKVSARRIFGGKSEIIDSSELSKGDLVEIGPGDNIPADAIVTEGNASVDQSSITGESLPLEVEVGDQIYAGTVNLNGNLKAKVTGSGSDTILGRVRDIIEDAKHSEAPIMRLTEDYARYYTPLILLIATSVFLFTQDTERAIAVLVVAIPCAFVLASPSAMVSAIASASRMGLLIKGSKYLEMAKNVDTVIFDKTGTLTTGQLSVHKFVNHSNHLKGELEMLTASIEAKSKHPVATCLASLSSDQEFYHVENFEEVHGRGVMGTISGKNVLVGRRSWLSEMGVSLSTAEEGNYSVVAVAIDKEHVADFYLADTIREDAGDCIEKLKYLGIERFVMLTGDRAGVAEQVANRLGIVDYHADCLPEDKLNFIRNKKEQGRIVMVVGDGLNDAPALAEGHLGVAMGALGNEVAIHTADVALMSHDFKRIPDLLMLSSKTVGIVNQNILWGFVFIITAIIISSMGLVSPILAAFFHEISAFFVIFNSARLLRYDGFEYDIGLKEYDSSPTELNYV